MTLMCLAGHPEHIFLVHAYVWVFLIFRLATLRTKKIFPDILGWGLASYLMMIGLSAFVLFPFLYNWVFEFWHSHPEYLGALVEAKGLMKEAVVSFFFPAFYQTAPVTLDFSRYSFWGHLGVIPLGLAFLGLRGRQRRWLNAFFAFLAFAIFAKSHIQIPFINWIGYLPLFNVCRFYHHTAHLFAFSVAVLAGMGIRRLLSGRKFFLGGQIYAGLVILLAGAALVYYRGAEHFSLSVRAVGWGLAALAGFEGLLLAGKFGRLPGRVAGFLVLAVLVAELSFHVPRERVRRFDSYPRVPYIEFLKGQTGRNRAYGVFWTMYPNTASGYGIDDFGIAEGLLPNKRFVPFINRLIFKDYFRMRYGGTAFWVIPATFMNNARPFLDMLNVRFTAAPLHLASFFPPAADKDFARPVYAREVLVYESPGAFPRAFIVHRAVFEPDEDRALEALGRLRGNLRDIAVLQALPDEAIAEELLKSPVRDGSAARIVAYGPNEVVVEADVRNAGLLVLSDAYHPEWKARVNGKPAKIYQANVLVRAVFLPAGRHTVRFIFSPLSFWAGVAVSFSSLFVLILLAFRIRGSVSRKMK